MARTKQSARKNASLCTPSSSSSSYQSRERSPSPPPRPSPPHSSSASPSPQNSQEVLNLMPLSTFLPPLYTRPTPNYAQVPPHLRTRITPPRRSMRVQSGIGTSKSMNPKPYYFIISDSESDDSSESCPPVEKSPTQSEPQRHPMPTVPTPPPQNPPTTTNPSTPSKSAFSSEPSHATPPHQKRRSLNDIVSPSPNQKEPLSQPKPPSKPMRTKNTITIAQFLARKNLPNPQRKKTLAPKQNLKNSQKPISPEQERSPTAPSQERSPSQEHSPTAPPPKSSPQKTSKRSSPISTSSDSEPSPPTKKPKQNAPPLISLAKSKLFNEKWAQRPVGIGRIFVFDNLVVDGNAVQHHTDALGWTSFLKISESFFPDVGVEIRLTPDILANILQLPTEGPSVFGDNWYSALGLRKTDVLAELFEENSTRYLATYLKPLPKVFNNMCQHTLLPHCGSHEYVSDNDALLIYHLLNCKRLNLPHVILQHMICAAQKDYKKNTVPYGMVLTKIFRHFGVSLASEKSLIKISKFSTKNLSHMRNTASAPTTTLPSCPISLKRKRSA
uniref:Vegetative cell wall protein gp1-like n=1 Tax=Cicer arietinum TaxID=3827 RepID=A0A1S2Z8M1_CICAR|nr:vegetative cell wall protein gp1-like [Cicer arietinum]